MARPIGPTRRARGGGCEDVFRWERPALVTATGKLMSRKHAELEREFIEDLVPRTGRSLAQWMAAIDAAGLADKNAIIDWLRPQGLTFAHASWLERIHNNGGRPIYLGISGGTPPPLATAGALPPAQSAPPEVQVPEPQEPSRATIPPAPAFPARPAPRAPPVSSAPVISTVAVAPRVIPATPVLPSKAPPAPPAAPPAGGVSALLARGKGLRPLAEMLLREIAAALPGATFSAADDLVGIANPAEIGVLLIGPRELRLGLDLGAAPYNDTVVRARIPGAGPRITHMLAVSDARQVDETLMALVRQAAARSGSER